MQTHAFSNPSPNNGSKQLTPHDLCRRQAACPVHSPMRLTAALLVVQMLTHAFGAKRVGPNMADASIDMTCVLSMLAQECVAKPCWSSWLDAERATWAVNLQRTTGCIVCEHSTWANARCMLGMCCARA